MLLKEYDLQNLSNWKPIIILYFLYNVAAKIMVGKIYPILKREQSHDSFGFRPWKRIDITFCIIEYYFTSLPSESHVGVAILSHFFLGGIIRLIKASVFVWSWLAAVATIRDMYVVAAWDLKRNDYLCTWCQIMSSLTRKPEQNQMGRIWGSYTFAFVF